MHLAALGLPGDADEFLEPLLGLLGAGVDAVAEACAKGHVEIGTDGMLHLAALGVLPDDGEPRKTRETISSPLLPIAAAQVTGWGGVDIRRHRVLT